MSTTAATGTTAQPTGGNTQAQNDYTKSFLRNAESKFLNLNTSDKEIMDLIIEASTSDKTNQGLMMGLQQLIDKRTQMVGTITNLLKKASDTIQEIVRNLRN